VVVSATPVLLALLGLAALRQHAGPIPARRVALPAAAIGTAALSHGVGIVLALVFPLLCVLLVPWSRFSRGARGAVVGLAWGSVVVNGLLRLAVASWLRDPLASWPVRPDPAVYARAVVEMAGHLIAYGSSAVVLGLWDAPARWPDARAVVAALATLALVSVAWRRADLRLPVLGLLLAAAVSYAAVAVGRADVYVRFGTPMAAAASTPRYHYLETIPLVLAIGLGMSAIPALKRPATGTVVLGVWLAVMGVGYAAARPPVPLHEEARRETVAAVHEIRLAVAAAAPGATVLIPNRTFAPARWIGFPFPGLAGVYMLYFPTDMVDGRRVRFVETPGTVEAVRRAGGRQVGLLVGPADEGAPTASR
jgi:hypothetical protein